MPFIVLGDGGSTAYKDLAAILDNLIQQRSVPPMIAIQIGNGGQDAQGSERGREYDTVSAAYTQFVDREVLPQVEQRTGAKLTKNPDGRATMSLSSSGAAAFTMAWFHPELYRRVLAYSPTMVNQQWPWDPSLRGGAWEYHSPRAGPAGPNLNIKAGVLSPSEPPGSPRIPSAPTKPIRFWFVTGDQDLFYPNPVMPDGMHDWVLSAERIAKVLADKGYHYLSLPKTSSVLAGGTRSDRLSRNDLVPGPVRSRGDLAIQGAGAAGSRDSPVAASVECAAPTGVCEAEAEDGGPTALRLALSAVSVAEERHHDHSARDCHAMASIGFPAVLALEVPLSGRSAESARGTPAADPGDEPGQPTLGCPAHPWRIAEARDRDRSVDGRQVHGQGWARAVTKLEDLPS
jgi:hypothetical protein